MGEGNGIKGEDSMVTAEEALEKIISQIDGMVGAAESEILGGDAKLKQDDETLTELLPGFPERLEGEIVSCDADQVNTDGIYPGKYTYQDDVTVEKMAEACMSNYDTSFSSIAKEGDILVAGFNFGGGSSREQACTAILAKKIPLAVSGSFGNIFPETASILRSWVWKFRV